MGTGGVSDGRALTGNGRRRVTYCIVPGDLAGDVYELLHEHFLDRLDVRVVVTRRSGERRQTGRRQGIAATGDERRKVQNPQGRRIADRRATAAEVSPLPLPAAAQAVAHRLLFIQRLEPSTRQREDVDTNRLVARFQAGERSAIDEIYMRYFDRVYGYARAMLQDTHEAEDIAQQVFVEALNGLERFEIRGGQPVRGWLFWIARNRIRDAVRKRSRTDVEPPETFQAWEEAGSGFEERDRLDWISDAEIARLVEQLPLSQRQVLVLRFLAGLTTEEICAALERSPSAVRVQQHRALRSLELQISDRRRAPVRSRGRQPMIVRARPATVARGRRFALVGYGVPVSSRRY